MDPVINVQGVTRSISGILRIAKEGAEKTRLMYLANLSYFQCNKLLQTLNEKGFIAKKGRLYKTTEIGLRVIDACEICYDLQNMPCADRSNPFL